MAAAASPSSAVLETSAATSALASASEASAESEEAWQPAPATFNLAYAFPDGADQSDPLKSYGGMAFRALYDKDTEWYSGIFGDTDLKPEEMARRLDLPADSVLGKYNVLDDQQKISDPSTWIVSKWGNIRMDIRDGNGKQVDASSNAKQILAMASVYGYYHDWTDYSDFLRYATSLWNSTHSYRVSMGSVYYDSGCITPEMKTSAVNKRNQPDTGSGILSGEDLLNAENAETGGAATDSDASAAAGTSSATSAAGQASSSVIHGTKAARSTESSHGTTAAAESTARPDPNAEISVSGTMPQSAAESTTAADGTSYPDCPGHIDLNVSAIVYGMDGAKSLFAKDKIGNSKEHFNDRWQGWTEETRQQAETLAASDWYHDYGLSISSFSPGSPLAGDEIAGYLSGLPSDLSEPRRKLITCALESVGKIPYYFGGKPSGPAYDVNHFYKVVSPDYKGRIFRGLDCSGWINWVYWTALGSSLSEESTSGLVGIGRSVTRRNLKPGDIIVRTGNEETVGHVVMFLKWNTDGTMCCIHETGGKINNVTVSDLDADWNFRSLVN